MKQKNVRRRRVRSLIAAAIGLLIFVTTAAVLIFAVRYEALKIAVGPPSSNDAEIIDVMTRLFARERHLVKLVPVISESAESAAKAFRDEKVDVAVVRSDELAPQARAVAVLRKNALVIWAPTRRTRNGPPRIGAISELSGQKIGLLGRASANQKMLETVFQASGVPADKVEIKVFASTDAQAMSADQSLAAYATVGPLDSKLTADAIAATVKQRGEAKFLSIDSAEALVRKFTQFETVEIPASSFSFSPARPTESIDTIGVAHLIVARQKLSDELVTGLTKSIFVNRQELLRELPGIATIEKPDTDKDSAIPVHPGAAAYIDGTERTFVEKYSDYFWGALLLASGIGSGFASLRAFIYRDEKDEQLELRDKLIELSAKARSEDSVGDLNELEAEADESLKEMIALHDEGVLNEGDLTAFGLALEHFRSVLSERRLTIKTEFDQQGSNVPVVSLLSKGAAPP